MSNESIPLRPLRILSPETAPAEPPPSDQARSARFSRLMTAASASRPDANAIAQAHDGEERLPDEEDGNAPGVEANADANANAESLPLLQPSPEPLPLLSPPSPSPFPPPPPTPAQADAPTYAAQYDANPDSPRESPTAAGPGAARDDLHALPPTDHAKQPAPNRRLAANRASSFSVRGNRPLTSPTGVAADSRLPSPDTPRDDHSSRLDLLTAHLSSLVDFTRVARDDQAVTIRLDPKILDDTTLHLAISRSRLSLRFQSPVPASRALIYAHADGLAARLEARVKRPTSIEVTA